MGIKKVFVGILFATLLMSLVGCERDDRHSGSAGKLNLRIVTSGAVTDVTTRSAEEDVPDINNFSMAMLQGGNVQASWDKISDYDDDTTFPVGTYTLRAFYGDMQTEGFASPYYEGSTDVEIKGGLTTEVETTCKLANTKLTIGYTDDFKSYFKTYSTVVKSEQGGEVTFTSAETRAAYVKPGRVSVKVTFTKATGGVGSNTIEVATIEEALPQHHYHLLMDVDAGKAMLSVIFDRVTEEKPITLDISDKALNIKAPYFTLTGFEKTNDQTNQWDGNLTEANKLSALLTSLGGFKKCILKTTSPNLGDWPAGGIDLANLTDETLNTLTYFGFKLTGFGTNKDQMAVIDFTGVVPHLDISDSNSEHLFYLQATSTYGKQSEEYVLNITTPKNFMLLPADPVKMGAKEVTLPIKLKEGNPEDVKLYYKSYGSWQLIANTSSQPILDKEGYYNLKAPVDMGFVAKEFVAEYREVTSSIITVTVIAPEYKIRWDDADKWATKGILTIEADDDDLEFINKVIRVYVSENNNQYVECAFGLEGKDRLVIKGLLAGKECRLQTSCDDGKTYSNQVVGITEENIQIPNADFTSGWKTITASNVSQGGRPSERDWRGNVTWKDAPIGNVIYDDLEDWFTTNVTTVSEQSKVRNRWYMVPSVLKLTNDEGYSGVTIRSVAWNDEGKPVPDNTAKTLLGGNDPVAPSNDAFKHSAGKIYLGSSYEGGIAFSSRPTSVSITCKYLAKKDDDGGTVNIQIVSNGNIIGEGKKQLSSTSWGEVSVPIEYTNFQMKATSLRLILTSSTKYWTGTEESIQTNNDTSNFISVGSEVHISEVKLNYN